MLGWCQKLSRIELEEEVLVVGACITMANEGPPIDWRAFIVAGDEGRLLELLVQLPRERWAEQDEGGFTLLHYACRSPNVEAVVALVQSAHQVGIHARALGRRVHAAPEVLCVAGADMQRATTLTTCALLAGASVNHIGTCAHCCWFACCFVVGAQARWC